MILYVNGDSHSAGAELVEDFCFAEDDKQYFHYGRTPHPLAIPKTFGHHLSRRLNCGYFLDAESASSNDRILRTTRIFLDEIYKTSKTIIIGWSSWEREEIFHVDRYYQLTASGTDSVPEDLQEHYKNWVANQTQDTLREKQVHWHDKIWDFHLELTEKNVQHLFFNAMQPFNPDWVETKDWGNCYIDPYSPDLVYINWAKSKGFLPANFGGNHYGEDAHKAWAKELHIRLTGAPESSTITKVITATVQPYKPR